MIRLADILTEQSINKDLINRHLKSLENLAKTMEKSPKGNIEFASKTIKKLVNDIRQELK
jgi:hypothetical protein